MRMNAIFWSTHTHNREISFEFLHYFWFYTKLIFWSRLGDYNFRINLHFYVLFTRKKKTVIPDFAYKTR